MRSSSRVSIESVSELQHPGPAAPGLARGRFLVVSDRLPVALTRDGGGGWRAAPAHGALTSALTPVLGDRRDVWIGWPGVTEEEVPGLRKVLAGAIQEGGCSLRPVMLTEEEKRLCYGGFSGEVIWPLFHDQPLECSFSHAYWQACCKVNRKFARMVAKTVAASGSGADLVWVHDALLIGLASELRRLEAPARTAFFLHLPFPSPDIFSKLPWRTQILERLLDYDQIGFQTERDLANFLICVRALLPGATASRSEDGLWTVSGAASETRAGAFPIGIDFAGFAERAARPEVEARRAALRQSLRGRKLVLGVDRLDRSNGIPEKLRAFAELLTRHPELREQVSLVQVVVPSRESLPRHAILRAEVERLVGEINGYFSRPGWVPVHYLHRSLDPEELLAYYRAADVALITPLKAGMGLTAKEYCAADREERGVLVLSEFAGAAPQLSCGALLVNPFDTRETARTLRRALRMKSEERGARMRRLRREVAQHNVFWWAGTFLASLLGRWPRTGARDLPS
ncbi:MAG TPA: trehalose-6-phosphate synthase [Thermoanaerobaculia bacterium]|nr:trehalose-6-phosphate synthase [Thermoanaerobaculia bacterium]